MPWGQDIPMNTPLLDWWCRHSEYAVLADFCSCLQIVVVQCRPSPHEDINDEQLRTIDSVCCRIRLQDCTYKFSMYTPTSHTDRFRGSSLISAIKICETILHYKLKDNDISDRIPSRTFWPDRILWATWFQFLVFLFCHFCAVR